MRTCLLFLLIIAWSQGSSQVKGYRIGKQPISGADESIQILIDEPKERSRSANSPIQFSGLITSTVGLGLDIYKSVVANEQQKYSANYSAALTGNNLMRITGNKAALNIDSIHILRTVVNPDLTGIVVSEIVLTPDIDPGTGLFRFQVARLNMIGSKAKIRKNGKFGKLLDLSIDIKLDAIWTEPNTSLKKDSIIGNAHSTQTNDSSFSYKSATLGSSSIIVTKIAPVGRNILREQFYSGWFQPLPFQAYDRAGGRNKSTVGNFTLTVNVKEINPYGLQGKIYSEILNGTSGDINALIKQLFPSSTK